MLIRSQDKKALLPIGAVKMFDECETDSESENPFETKYLCTVIENDSCSIGEYSSEEKAIKVMDDIAYNYAFDQTIKNNQGSGCQITLEPFVFQMPKDEDVIV